MNTITEIPFHFDAKAAVDTRELANGSLVFAGYGARFDTEDLESEWWDGKAAFPEPVLDEYLKSNAPLCYAHRRDEVVGRILSADVKAQGVWVTGVVDPQDSGSPLRYIYDGVKRGRINGLSVSGIFERKAVGKKIMLSVSRIVEWSIAPISIGVGTSFNVVASKALTAGEGKSITATGEVVKRNHYETYNEQVERYAEETRSREDFRRRGETAAQQVDRVTENAGGSLPGVNPLAPNIDDEFMRYETQQQRQRAPKYIVDGKKGTVPVNALFGYSMPDDPDPEDVLSPEEKFARDEKAAAREASDNKTRRLQDRLTRLKERK